MEAKQRKITAKNSISLHSFPRTKTPKINDNAGFFSPRKATKNAIYYQDNNGAYIPNESNNNGNNNNSNNGGTLKAPNNNLSKQQTSSRVIFDERSGGFVVGQAPVGKKRRGRASMELDLGRNFDDEEVVEDENETTNGAPDDAKNNENGTNAP
eukprot:CAMPEP_0114666550 /NCGR_PEP_ID=MMETSP0191-20121206/32752_1 /TAXON_ID=126664 /ORGANISM="Sorites sp." /LENGTH=153 /DNA_ID=CAMNT_0001914469 /DNA_START=357 /DNA_END=815 /DNA_ORIENTATION=+